MVARLFPYFLSFLVPLAMALLLTPAVREACRRVGMIDKPDPRRINKVPIPRGGGVAVFASVILGYLAVQLTMRFPPLQGMSPACFYRLCAIATGVTVLGLVDDKFSISPRAKLLGQIVLAFLTWWWADLGFAALWPQLPAWLDCIMTIFWIVGAVNAFNLIDGLDGLASGLAMIAVIGMAGALFLSGNAQSTFFYFAMAGGLLGFLRYNFNPASVFLGDSGSMFIGFIVAVLPLASEAPNSFVVSIGVPMLAMGVPIFDTSLAIIRRTIRRLLYRRDESAVAAGDSDRVMTADHDHLHHRILRAVGLNQRLAAFVLYGFASLLVFFGLLGMALESRAAGLWLAAVSIISVIIVRDMARVELFDAAALLGRVAHSRDSVSRHRLARLTVPFYVIFDLAALAGIFFLAGWALNSHFTRSAIRIALPLRVFSIFIFLVVFHAYRTVWSRAQPSNFMRLFVACLFGTIAGSVAIYYAPVDYQGRLTFFTLLYASFAFIALMGVRLLRVIVRDLFYALDCSRLRLRDDVSRILVYGGGLRYRAYRRNFVRSASANQSIIVGIIDDDILLRGQMIGGKRVYGTFMDMEAAIRETGADTVVIACELSEKRLNFVCERLRELGVKIRSFQFVEKEL